MLEMITENVANLRNKPDYVLNMLTECSTLKDDEDYVRITTITSIDELENILTASDRIDVDENSRVKVKKKKK